MHLRPVGQCAVPVVEDGHAEPISEDEIARTIAPQEPAAAPPVVALFDGMPLAAHRLLDNRVIVDDPDGYEAEYQADERVHGTEMASIICHGDIGGGAASFGSANRPVYVRPIMKPSRRFGVRFPERIPEEILPVDLVHRSVRRAVRAGRRPASCGTDHSLHKPVPWRPRPAVRTRDECFGKVVGLVGMEVPSAVCR